MASKGQKFKKYTPEEKIKYAKMIVNGELSASEIARALNTGRSTVKGWRNQYLEHGEAYFYENHHGSTSGNPYAALHTKKNLTEIERLRLELAKKEVECERLKKGYSVKGVGQRKEYVTINKKNSK